MPSPLDIRIVDTPFDPNSGDKIIYYRTKEGRKLYKVWIYLDGRDTIFISSVQYTLHRTFAQQEHVIERTFNNPHFRLVIYTWGVFDVNVLVTAKGYTWQFTHPLTYDQRFSEAKYSVQES